MPVHAHHSPKTLEPKGMSKAAKQLVSSVFMHDRFADHGAEPRHPDAEPSPHPAAVEREIGTAATMRHYGALAMRSPDAASRSNSGSARPPSSKLDTVTPRSRTPLAGGNS